MTRFSALLFVLTLFALDARASDEILKLSKGARAMITLAENPSTGYSWKIDSAGSANLDILRIVDGGFVRRGGGAQMVGAPGVHKWAVEALAPGQATINFIYLRPWENAPVRTHRVVVRVAR